MSKKSRASKVMLMMLMCSMTNAQNLRRSLFAMELADSEPPKTSEVSPSKQVIPTRFVFAPYLSK